MQAADLDAVLEIERRSHPRPWSRQIFIEELARDFAQLVVLRERERRSARVVAFMNTWLVGDELHLLNVATHPDHRRRGHAARLLGHLVAQARARRVRLVTLEVRRDNLDAIRLYRAHGFAVVGVRHGYYAHDGADALCMLLELGVDREEPSCPA
jgi:ribosomal-protein-alanine N-acetyltransferase